ncbi:MAG: DUF5715 family protein [Actinomycetota bacterium]|nr:DUF5715 family protein [Actinomycetota bacterium]
MSDPTAAELAAYRAAVEDVAGEVGGLATPTDRDKVESRVASWLADPVVGGMAARVPAGAEAVATSLVDALLAYRANRPSAAADLSTLVRIHLLSQIDVIWWGTSPMFVTDADVDGSPELVDLEPLRRAGRLAFRYHRQPAGLVGRGRDWAARRLAPDRRPRTAGLRFARARPEGVALLNQVAGSFREAASHAPPLWVTSLVRSLDHQHRLRSLGYAALLPSAHCAGFAMDVEVHWYRRSGTDGALREVLTSSQDAGLANIIDEGQAWHVCINPASRDALAGAYRRGSG